MIKEKKPKPGLVFVIHCKSCGQPLEKGESPIEHIRKHPITTFFEVVGYADWERKM